MMSVPRVALPAVSGEAGADRSPRVPGWFRALPPCPAGSFTALLPLVASEPALLPAGVASPSAGARGGAQQWDTAGLAAGLCAPWPAPLTSGIPPCVRDVGPVLLLTPGQPQQGLCLLNLSIAGHLQLYHRADHLNPSSCTCWGWSCQEQLHCWKKPESFPFCSQHPHGAEHSACDFQSCCQQHSGHSDLHRRCMVQLHGPGPWDQRRG